MSRLSTRLSLIKGKSYIGASYAHYRYFDYKVVPQKGKIVLFPSSFAYSHIAHPVEEGTKYTAINWYK